MPRIEALLSDLDGTLVDTEPLYFESYRAVAQKLGAGWTNPQHVAHMLGKPQATGFAAFLAEIDRAHVSHAQLLALRDAELLPRFEATALLPGAAAAVAACRAGGLRCGIVTSSKRNLVGLKMRMHADFMAHFELVVCNDDAVLEGKAGKPDPACYHAAAAGLGVDIRQCLVFEDSLLGIRAGVAAGAFVVAVPDGRLPMDEVLAERPHLVLKDLREFSLERVLAMEV